jgi:hypothetical protein
MHRHLRSAAARYRRDDNTCIVDADVEVLDAPELATAIIERGDRYPAAERF